MSHRWSLAELTEFDLRLHYGEDAELPDDLDASPEKNRSDTLLDWLRHSRKPDSQSTKMALSAVRTESWIRVGVFVLSAFIGIGAASALLHYGGERLINVSAYLGVLVGGQLLYLILLLLSMIWLRSRLGIKEELFLPKILRETPSPQSLNAWRWRLFTTFQLGGVAMNLGILLATLWRVVTFDLAFGWATTLDTQPETISTLVQVLSAPWGGAYTPDPEQIRNSRIVLLEGFSNVDAASTASWWPFLLCCVGMYGLLPRVILTSFGAFNAHRQLARPSLASPEAERLFQRLHRPALRFQSKNTGNQTDPIPTGSVAPLRPSHPMRLELPEEIRASLDPSTFSSVLEEKLRLTLTEDLQQSGVLFLIEAWQPPLEETLRFFRHRRAQEGPEAEFLVLAVGVPNGAHGFEAPSPQDVSIWSRKLSELQDPLLGLVAWEGNS